MHVTRNGENDDDAQGSILEVECPVPKTRLTDWVSIRGEGQHMNDAQ